METKQKYVVRAIIAPDGKDTDIITVPLESAAFLREGETISGYGVYEGEANPQRHIVDFADLAPAQEYADFKNGTAVKAFSSYEHTLMELAINVGNDIATGHAFADIPRELIWQLLEQWTFEFEEAHPAPYWGDETHDFWLEIDQFYTEKKSKL